MICDDSVVIRGAIARLVGQEPSIRVVSRVANGAAALEALKTEPVDVVILDIEMPVMDGMTALPLLLKASPGLKIIMASTLTVRGADIAMRALRLGAADYVPKPSASAVAGDQAFGAELIAKIRGLARLKNGSAARLPPTAALQQPLTLRPAPRLAPRLLAIGSSTGGPNALFALVQSLRAGIGIPIVLTQHMPASFTPILAQHIDKLGVLPCAEATDGAVLRPGHILLAPGDRHMLVQRSDRSRSEAALNIRLTQTAPENFCRPSVDPMLRTACEAVEGRVLVVMLTGMGQDGLLGSRQIVEAGGALIAQDEATSVVWGMPGAVARAGLAHAILPLPQIGQKILSMIGTRP
jgi:two-component system chemotaxis response regulator CheB